MLSQNLKHTFRNLAENDIFRMAGATAFFTTFALPPILMVIVRILGLFSDRRTVGRALLAPLRQVFGPEAIEGLLQTIRSFRALEGNYFIATGIFIFLLFVATTLFRIIRNSINQLWAIRVVPGINVVSMLRARALAIVVILAGGLLFLSVQVFDAVQHLISRYVNISRPETDWLIWKIVKLLTATLIASIWFYMLFHILPDGRPPRKIAIKGAVVTGILFTGGKTILGVLLQPTKFNTFYGASGAFALIMLFMFYSSIFLYFGAALIRALADSGNTPIVPRKHAERYMVVTA